MLSDILKEISKTSVLFIFCFCEIKHKKENYVVFLFHMKGNF